MTKALPLFLGALAISFGVATPAFGQSASFAITYSLPDGVVRTLSDGGAINFPATDVNSSSAANITVLNQGAAAGSVNSISVTGTGFVLSSGTALPITVGAGGSFRFSVLFSPTLTGGSSGTLRINLSTGSVTAILAASTTTTSAGLAVSYALADGNVHQLTDGTAITFPSVDINATTTAVVSIVNTNTGTGAASGTLTGLLVSGTGFQLSNTAALPATIAAGQTLRFGIVFAPTQVGSFTGSFRIDLAGRSISGTLSASTPPANFSLSYIDPNTGNTLPLPNNASLQFPSTLAGTTASINLLASNTGTGTGFINSITLLSGTSGYQLLSLPPLPLSVPPGQQLKFGIRFSPLQQQSYADTLRIDLNGQINTISLQGQGTQAQYTYSSSTGSGSTPLSAGGTLAIPDTAVGQTTNVVISVSNSGTGDGQISTVTITGQGYALSNLPALPFTLHPNGSQQFTLTFAPTQPGAISGKLTIGNDTFTVNATGIGPRLIYTYTSGSSGVTVTDGGTVIFSPLAVGNTGTLSFSIQNTGTSSATISSINLAAPSTVFALLQLPSLPMNLSPNATVSFQVSFVPNNTGSLTASLRVNNATFTLSGNGTQPAALSAYQFQGPSGTVQPAQQPAVGLTLASAYPLALQGTLKLTFVSAVFTDDPTIQFATGGRSVNFTIPANTTQAVFGSNAPTVALQTGTTAGNIVITPSFAMQTGFDLTPASPAVLTLTIPRLATQLQNASVSGETTNSFTVVLTGYTTTRTLRQLDIQVTPQAGQNLSASHLTIDVNSSSAAWFQSAASQAFGGSFLVAIPFTLSGGSATDLVHLLQSLSITATNDVGASNALTLAIP